MINLIIPLANLPFLPYLSDELISRILALIIRRANLPYY